MTSYLPQWLIDIATIISYLGFAITIAVWFQTKQIRSSFLIRARLPEVNKELRIVSSNISSHILKWTEESKLVHQQLLVSKALIENLMPKLPDSHKKKCKAFIYKLSQRKYFFLVGRISDIDEDEAWKLYTEMSEITTMLIQLEKDSKWD